MKVRDIIEAFKTGLLYTVGLIITTVIMVFVGFICKFVISTIFDLLV